MRKCIECWCECEEGIICDPCFAKMLRRNPPTQLDSIQEQLNRIEKLVTGLAGKIDPRQLPGHCNVCGEVGHDTCQPG